MVAALLSRVCLDSGIRVDPHSETLAGITCRELATAEGPALATPATIHPETRILMSISK